MKFVPKNRHFLVETQQSQEVEEESNMVLLPAGYSPPKEAHEVVVLVAAARDCSFKPAPGTSLIIEGHMLREVQVAEKTYFLVQENYVLGTFGEEWE